MLRAEGHNVVGLTMQLWNQRRLAGHEGMPEAVQGRCCSLDDVYDARRVAETIGIPYYVVNQEDRFEHDVVRPFVAEYLSGRTPIPCSLCNNHLKFDQLLITAQQIGADALATGHYARVGFDADSGRWLLKRPADFSKDQTYFLFGLTQDQLSRTLFPLGEMTKPEVRELARRSGLALAEKRDSQEICFVPAAITRILSMLISANRASPCQTLPASLSPPMARSWASTVASTTSPSASARDWAWPPAHLCTFSKSRGDTRQVVVGNQEDLYSKTLRVHRTNLISVEDLTGPMRVTVKIRHRHEGAPAVIEKTGDDEILATFDQPQRAITPGQAAVFYDGDIVVGGGWIA